MRPRQFGRQYCLGILAAVALAFPWSGSFAKEPVAAPQVTAAAPSNRWVPGLEEPLVAVSAGSPAEVAALSRAVEQFEAFSRGSGDFRERARPLEKFLQAYPDSGWRLSLLTNLGIGYYHDGYFSKAIGAWQAAWDARRSASRPAMVALADRAAGELARMHARVGHADELEKLMSEIGDRPVSGAATELLAGAREGLWMFRNDPGVSYLCGPMALKSVLQAMRVEPSRIQAIYAERSGPNGYSFAQVSALAKKLGLDHRVVVRSPNEPVPVPSIINWKVNHFAAIIEEREGRYLVQDPTFGSGDLWVSKEAIDAESSGYFLVPTQASRIPVASAWRDATVQEAERVYGMGYTSTNEPGATKPNDNSLGCGPSTGMCTVNAKLATVSLNLNDSPVGYKPALGPSAKIVFSYNQREAGQPAVFSFSNVSPKWSLNVMSWVQDNPNSPGNSVTRFLGGGGYIAYSSPYTYSSSTGLFSPERQGQAVLARVPAAGALTQYELRMSDGSKLIYGRPDGAASFPRRVFLTSVVDAAGNALTLNYDAQLRLANLTDAVGRQTLFEYGNVTAPLLITKIIDPFGRSANVDYDASGRLLTITDVIGLQSKFTYDSGGLVQAMTTPYGTSNFLYGDSGTTRYLEIKDPLGLSERVEFQHSASGMPYSDPVAPAGYTNQYLYYRNTFHWDKSAYAQTGRDYLKAKVTHWLHNPQGQTSPIVESTKEPFERRVWLKYPDQSIGYYEGSSASVTSIARVLDDGSTQESKYTYNSLGLRLSAIDALGRKTVYVYDTNNVDLLRIQQQVTAGGTLATIASFTYNAQHRPLTYTDAAGQTTKYAYNVAGQPISAIDAKGKTTTYEYDNLGRLSRIVNAAGVTQESRTYDELDRLETRTDSEGHVLSYTYDALDRLTQILYPDGSKTLLSYDRLDLGSVTDRLGRVTSYTYDANRRIATTTDPLGRVTAFAYHGNGVLRSVTDPKGNTTSWDIDLQGRQIAKRFADGKKETFAYEDTTSRLRSTTDALGQIRSLTYYTDDQVKAVAYANAVNATAGVSFTYDAFFPRRASMTDGLGTTVWTYVSPGSPGALKVATETGPYAVNNTVAYGYDELGRILSRSVDASTESYGYDDLGRLTNHASALGSFNFGYLGQSAQMTSRQSSTGLVSTQWVYEDNVGDRRLKALNHSGLARSFGLSTNEQGLVTALTETGGGLADKTWSLAYDEGSRLVSATPTSGVGALYAHDAADNLQSLANSNGSHSVAVNALNQITSFDGLAYSYDANGNLLNDGVRTYAWDAENRLQSVSINATPGKKSVFKYDGLGRRLAIVDSTSSTSTETRYMWCGASICQARDVTNTVIRRYFDEGVTYPQGGTALYYGHDQIGSVRDVSAVQTGTKVASFDYDAYGDATKVSGRILPEFRYAGMFYHGASGLHLTNYRAYDAKTGRWTSRDPIGENGGLNLYAYVRGNPVSSSDPYGLCDEKKCEELSDKIEKVRDELAKRADDLRTDVFNLPLLGRMSIGGHIQQFQNKQTQLRNLLNDYNSEGCGGGGGGLPADAWSYATMDAPKSNLLDAIQKATGLTGAALIAYLIVSEGSRLFPPRNLIPVL